MRRGASRGACPVLVVRESGQGLGQEQEQEQGLRLAVGPTWLLLPGATQGRPSHVTAPPPEKLCVGPPVAPASEATSPFPWGPLPPPFHVVVRCGAVQLESELDPALCCASRFDMPPTLWAVDF